jgi:predicted amidohydrolase
MTDHDGSGPGVLRTGVVQMTSGADTAANVARAGELVAEAAAAGATLVALPEKWHHMDAPARAMRAAEPLDGPSLTAAADWARTHAIAVLAGSVIEAIDDEGPPANTSVLFGPDGTALAVYRKLHLFDVEVGGRVYRESDGARAGDRLATGWLGPVGIGMSVCYDLRFPELYRALAYAGVRLLAVPAAFTAATGRAHWEALLRARAIENQCFVLAPGQVGRHPDGSESHGHSMVIDPWGVVLAEVGEGEGVAVADLDLAAQDEVRTRLPALRHRREDVFGAPGPIPASSPEGVGGP